MRCPLFEITSFVETATEAANYLVVAGYPTPTTNRSKVIIDYGDGDKLGLVLGLEGSDPFVLHDNHHNQANRQQRPDYAEDPHVDANVGCSQ